MSNDFNKVVTNYHRNVNNRYHQYYSTTSYYSFLDNRFQFIDDTQRRRNIILKWNNHLNQNTKYYQSCCLFTTSTKTLMNNGSDKKYNNAEEQHKIFREQIDELQNEQRNEMFGSTTATTLMNSDTEKSLSAEDQHQIFREQMDELQKERNEMFGSSDHAVTNDDDVPFHNNNNNQMIHNNNDDDEEESIYNKGHTNHSNERIKNNNDDSSLISEKQKIQRESMFGFEDDEKIAWSTSGGIHHQYDQEFLKSIEIQRNEYYTDYQSQQRPTEDAVIVDNNINNHKTDHNIELNHQLLSHVTNDGTSVQMVDVGEKIGTKRIAIAQSIVSLPPEVIKAFTLYNPSLLSQEQQDSNNNNNNQSSSYELIGKKGPIFTTAKIAGIMATKKTFDLIPLCHPIQLDYINIDIQFNPIISNDVIIQCTCHVSNHKTGVEMEALIGATITALTIYDMTKAISHHIIIHNTKLIHKSGGKRTYNDNDNNNNTITP